MDYKDGVHGTKFKTAAIILVQQDIAAVVSEDIAPSVRVCLQFVFFVNFNLFCAGDCCLRP